MASFQNKIWEISEEYKEEDVQFMMQQAECSFLTAKVLLSRFGRECEQAESFLTSSLSHLELPFKLNGFRKAAERVLAAIDGSEPICIYGDFDMDGLTATALLNEVLTEMGGRVTTYIPDRIDEGYGMNPKAMEEIVSREVKLLISVDCGIKAVNEVAYLNKNNIDCIITDHHERGDQLPDAFALLNPKLSEEDSSAKNLAGVGVAFKLAHAILLRWKEKKQKKHEYDLRRTLDLVALGTIADVVPLDGENRILVKAGLAVLNKSTRTGLQYVMERANIKSSIGTYHVAFLLAPRFNAAGRLGHADEAFRLLTTSDNAEADRISLKLEEYNEIRRDIELKILREAESQMNEYADSRIAVLEDSRWHTGVIGIVASRLSERMRKPVLLIGSNKGQRRGSGRSFGEFNLIEALETMDDLFVAFGGHKAACGFSIEENKISDLRKRLSEYADSCPEKMFLSKIRISAKTDFRDLSMEEFGNLKKLEPFGFGNPRPVLLIKGLTLLSSPRIIKEKHVSFRFEKDGKNISGIWYNCYDYVKKQGPLSVTSCFDVVFQLEVDDYYKSPRTILKMEDMAFSQ